MNTNHTSTTFEIPCYKIKENLGMVRGIIVRSRSVVGNIGAALQILFGGNITILTSLCERARSDALKKCWNGTLQWEGLRLLGGLHKTKYMSLVVII